MSVGEIDSGWLFDDEEIVRRRQALASLALQTEVLSQPRSRLTLENESQLQDDGKVEILLSDGSRLNLQTQAFGPEDGWPIILFHGMPGSSVGPRPRSIWLHTGGIRIIALDLPGYGDSDRHEGHIVGDSATYAEAIAKAYGIKKCSVAGRSGGGPSGLACANELPDLVVNTAVFAGIAPSDADIDWHEGASAVNAVAYRIPDPEELARLFMPTTDASQEDIHAVLQLIAPEMSYADTRYLQREAVIRELIALSHADGLRNGYWGWVDSVIAARMPWGFDPKNIRVPVTLIQGEDDPWTLRQHFRWLADNISSANAILLPNMGHMGTLDVAPNAYELLRDQAQHILTV